MPDMTPELPPAVSGERFEFESEAGRLSAYVAGQGPPLLLIHDPDDPDSPYAASERVAAAWPGARLLATRGLGRLAHYRILRHRPAISAGVDFIGR